MKGGHHWHLWNFQCFQPIIWTLVTGNHHSCLICSPKRGKFIGLHHRVEDEVVHVKRGYFKSPLFQRPVWRGWTYRPGLFTIILLHNLCSLLAIVASTPQVVNDFLLDPNRIPVAPFTVFCSDRRPAPGVEGVDSLIPGSFRSRYRALPWQATPFRVGLVNKGSWSGPS